MIPLRRTLSSSRFWELFCDIIGLTCITVMGFVVALWLGLLLAGLGFIGLGLAVRDVTTRGDTR